MALQEKNRSPASLIVIGAPPVEALEALLAGGRRKVVLVEPDPERAEDLRQRFREEKQVRIIAAGVGADAGEAELHVFNFPGLRSLHVPGTALREILPGLKLRASKTVEVVTPAQLLDDVGDVPRPWHLHIDALGSEHGVLEGLVEAGALYHLELVRVRSTGVPFFDGHLDCPALQEWAVEHGFMVADTDDTDPDFPEIVLHADAESRVAELEKQVADLTAQNQTQQNYTAVAQADRRDFQDRYLASEKTRTEQQTLLRQLAGRLRQVMDEVTQLQLPQQTTSEAAAERPASSAAKAKRARVPRKPSAGTKS